MDITSWGKLGVFMRLKTLALATAVVAATALYVGCVVKPAVKGKPVLASAAAASHDADSGEDKLVCRREKELGTHMVRRVCRYQSAIDADRQSVQRELQNNMARRAKPGQP